MGPDLSGLTDPEYRGGRVRHTGPVHISMHKNDPLDNISIILVEPRTPANIGATARCMMNMGLHALALVNPLKELDGEAYKLAAGADQVLSSARTYPSLSDAIAGHGLVIGTSRQTSRRRKNVRSPREMAEQVAPLLSRNRTAIVFGNEVNGLANSDLALCHEIVSIPSSDAFPSLNLSHAVMVIAYELFTASRPKHPGSPSVLAPAEDLEGMYCHLQETLLTIGFFRSADAERMMFSLKQLFNRSRMDSREVAILRGILNAMAGSTKRHE